MSDPCRVWIALSDRAAAGESLAASELELLERHPSSCSVCRAEAGVWSALSGALDDPALLTEPLAVMADRTVSPPAPARLWSRALWSRSKHKRLAMLAALAAAISGSFALFAWRVPQRVTEAQVQPTASRTRVAFVAGEARVNRRRAAAGQDLTAGDVLSIAKGYVCLLVPPGVTVCADEHTELVIDRVGVAERRLTLRMGHVVARLTRQPAGTSFGFETSAGSVVAKGTVFALDASGQDVQLRVQEGTVAVGQGTDARSFVAPAAARVAAATNPEPLSAESAARDKPLIQLAQLWTESATCTLDITTTAQAGHVSLDGMYLGLTPVTGLVRPGSYRLSVEQPGFAPVAERLTVLGGERMVRNYELLPIPSSNDGALASGPGDPVALDPTTQLRGAMPQRSPSPAALLAQASTLRGSGRFVEARSIYGRLIAQHPGSAEALAALVSLGELQLSQFGDAKAALKSFDAYVRAGGSLAQEARYGRIRALRKLGRHAEEQAAIDRFLADYPHSVQAATLRARLSESFSARRP